MSDTTYQPFGLVLYRKTRNTARAWWLWNQQGRQRDIPVVIKPGRLIASPDGISGRIDGFTFDIRYMTEPATTDEDWDTA